MTFMQLSVRDVNEQVFRAFKAKAVKSKLNVGQAITLAMKHWLEEHAEKKSFLSFKPKSWGKGTEQTSQEIDKVLYS